VTRLLEQPLWAADWQAIGTGIRLVVTEPGRLAAGRRLLEDQLAELDEACSRFRPDSELVRVTQADGRPVQISRLLTELVAVALDAAASTDGDLDPTVGEALVTGGYDRDFELLPADGPPVRLTVHPVANWRNVTLVPEQRLLTVPSGVTLDLGATAKAWAADRAAVTLANQLDCGVLVGLGGDIAVAGPPPEQGWRIRVQDLTTRPDLPSAGPAATVTIHHGGLATSSTAGRSWRRGAVVWHHVLDPRTGWPARPVWRTVSVFAGTALDANVASTTCIVRGHRAPAFLAARGWPARLVSVNGDVCCVGGWPTGDRE
jgi:thiamine biosynthesis lipoprotein